jgi:predicted RNA binding protein YcfA (HicA-like mRNA interferase family)
MSRLPETTAKHLARALRKAGFFDDHQEGSHLTFRHGDGRRVTVPMHPGAIKRHLVKLILKQAGLSEDDFRELL